MPGEQHAVESRGSAPHVGSWGGAPRAVSSETWRRWALRLLATAVGGAVWALALAVVVVGPKNPQGVLAVVLCLPAIGATALALRGWRFLAQYPFGSYGHLLKFLALLAVAATVVGLVPICYWTGRAVLRVSAGDLP